MDKALLDILLCPVCGGALHLEDAATETVTYDSGPREEIRSGLAACDCGMNYPIADFVLSLSGVFPAVLRQEAAYWDRYYMWLLEQGSLGFHDLTLGQAPYITMGVPEPFPASDTVSRYTVHHQIAEHPRMRTGSRLFDIGVGLGWTSLYLARAGYSVTAIEPSLGPVTAAKRYAMEQGVAIEYICAAMGHILFKPNSFDNVTAFHSLHHVPDLRSALCQVREWLREGGTLALDEHVGNSKLAAAVGREIHLWAESEVLPPYRTLSDEAMSTLPNEPHSALEDSSVNEVEKLVNMLFTVEYAKPRHVFLDHYPMLYYLKNGRDEAGFMHGLEFANEMQEFVRRADPEGGDYLTIIAVNTRLGPCPPVEEPPAPEPVEEQAVAPEEPVVDPRIAALEGRIHELEGSMAEQSAWAKGLEGELRRKNSELSRLQTTIQRMEQGRVFKLISAGQSLVKRGGRKRRK